MMMLSHLPLDKEESIESAVNVIYEEAFPEESDGSDPESSRKFRQSKFY
jgi:hypothetical protein